MIADAAVRAERPADRAQLACVVSACNARGEAVVFRGGDTFRSLGFLPERCDVAIDMRGLDRVVAYEPADLTIGVECGVTIDALGRTLAKYGQFVPLDVPRGATATIGGALAAGWLGPRRASYGRLRDAIIGSTAVLADGTIANAGGMVVKNVTGYDLSRLYIGSLGSLVAIASVNFKTLPIPASRVALRAAIPAGALARALDAIRRADVEPTAALLNVGYAKELGFNPGDDASLLALFEGSEPLTSRGIRALTAALAGCGVTLATIDRAADNVLAEMIDASIAPVDARTTIYKTFGSPTRLETRYAALCDIAKIHGFTFEAILDARTGDLIARFTPSQTDENETGTLAIDAAIQALPERALVQRAPDSIRNRISMWGRPTSGSTVMAALKHQFDPNRTLAPGRFLNHL